jgi:UDP-3-O-[3-hydroxymyristoyl] glucosamine N-acyltransferase LpxD
MWYNVRGLSETHDFPIVGVSYIGEPKPNTAMFVVKKVESLLENLKDVSECLVFAEDTIEVPDSLEARNCFVYSAYPQKRYADFVRQLSEQDQVEERARKYTLTPGGYHIGEHVQIGEGAHIEPGCIIGHGVVIGTGARICANATIKHAVIGDNFIANEGAVIGSAGFSLTKDEAGAWNRTPTLGCVVIGDDVEIGANNNISRGVAGATRIADNVKIDALVYIGHDAVLGKHVEIMAGVIVAGFVRIEERVSIGMNACIRNRITLGERCTIGMGSTVTRSVESGITVVGNPARRLEKA